MRTTIPYCNVFYSTFTLAAQPCEFPSHCWKGLAALLFPPNPPPSMNRRPFVLTLNTLLTTQTEITDEALPFTNETWRCSLTANY